MGWPNRRCGNINEVWGSVSGDMAPNAILITPMGGIGVPLPEQWYSRWQENENHR
jgi:hypothetical protein